MARQRAVVTLFAVAVAVAVAVAKAVAVAPGPAGATTGPPGTAPARAAQELRLSGEDLASRLGRPDGVDLTGAVIAGDVELRGLGTVAGPVRCRGCRFEGAVRAHDVVFRRPVDLSGSTVSGEVVLRGAVFEEPVLFERVEDERTRFASGVDLSLATFNDRASFADAAFTGELRAASAKFGASASFLAAHFAADADFSGVSFTGVVTCLICRFSGSVTFAGAELQKGATFVGAVFEREATFDYVRSSDVLDGSRAIFLDTAAFFAVDARGTLRLVDARFSGRVIFNDVSTEQLFLDLDNVRRIDGREQQIDTLRTLEEHAGVRGDLGLANGARFARLDLLRADHGALGRFLDFYVYRTVFGYLVRPLYPALFLGVAILAFSLWWWRRPPEPGAGVDPVQPAPGLGGHVHRTVVRAASVRGDGLAKTEGRLGATVEFVVTKLLLAGVLLGLASSNATLREMLDAIR